MVGVPAPYCGIPWWERCCYHWVMMKALTFIRSPLTALHCRWEGGLITTAWQQKSGLPTWSLLTFLVEISYWPVEMKVLATCLDFSGWGIEVPYHSFTRAECLGSPPSLCWHGQGRFKFFLWCLTSVGQLLSTSYLSLGCPCFGPLAKEIRLLLGHFFLYLLTLPGCLLLQLQVWAIGSKNPGNSLLCHSVGFKILSWSVLFLLFSFLCLFFFFNVWYF